MKNIFLTDDDMDDCCMFSDALNEVYAEATLTIANNGLKLMEALEENISPSPEIIFLDLNMPFKNGFECLDEIRKSPRYQDIPIIIYSTTSNNDIVEKTYQHGANYYICKPASYSILKKTILYVLSLDLKQLLKQPVREHFIINVA